MIGIEKMAWSYCIVLVLLFVMTERVHTGLSGYPSTLMLDGEALLVQPEQETTDVLDRHRRYLLFRPMSLLQFTYAYAMPVELMPKRMLLIVLGGQIAYDLPSNLSQLTVQDVARRKLEDVAVPNVLRAAEIMLDQKGMPGRDCMLLAVCQLAETPLDRDMGLLEDILHIFLTPSEGSISDDWISKEEERQYMEAESIGKNGTLDCRSVYSKCNVSILDAFTRIMLT